MIRVASLSLQFAERVLFQDVNIHIGARDRIGLVGANGAGKTTLLRIIAGEMHADAGSVVRARHASVGYLPQEGIALGERSLRQEAESVFSEDLALEERIGELQEALALSVPGSEDHEDTLEVLGELQHRLELSDVFRRTSLIEKVLAGLGFARSDLERLTGEFSGGWQMRIALAKLLLREPSLLLLDEPTNHLDIESLEWLEDYLGSYRGAMMLVSHDRRFLDTMTTRTLEVRAGSVVEYAGNYSAYVVARGRRREQLEAAWKQQQNEIRETERFIERFRYKATKARQVQSRIKQLEKLERIELEDSDASIRFEFPPSPPSGSVLLRMRGVRKRYGTLEVLPGVSLDIDRGDRIAVVGVNGAGKSTLARVLAAEEPFEEGERQEGHGLRVAYFAQDQAEELSPEATALEILERSSRPEFRPLLRTILGSFLFRGDDVFKRVAVLSGGERSRLALARMLVQPANLLVMDEPTNHLDMRSKEILQNALKKFDGTFVIVSHDRDFLDGLVTRVVEIDAGSVRVFPGSVGEYLERKHRERLAEVGERPARPSSDRERKRREAQERQEHYRLAKPLRERLGVLEAEIQAREERKAECEIAMSDPALYTDPEQIREVTAEFKRLGEALAQDYQQWSELITALDRLERARERSGER
jgi:ATP-binding cassette subfamily F protein 3